MQSNTPAPDTRGDLQHDPSGRHGDVDTNGDLVDQLDDRLRSAISAPTRELADDQLRAVKQLVRPWTVTP